MKPPLLDPRNDLVFKKLFTNCLPLLTDLINAVRSHEPPINVIRIENPQVDAETVTGKYIVLDILAQDAEQHYYNIEMQMSRRNDWSARSMVYLSKILSGQLKSGDDYDALRPVIGIHLLNYDLFPEHEQALWCFEMRDRTQPAIRLGREMQLNILELRKAEQTQQHHALATWIQYFTQWKDENIMSQIQHGPVNQAMEQLQALSADDQTRYLAEARERALMTERVELRAALRRGEEKGQSIGEARGEAIGLQKALQKMIANGIPEAQARAILEI